MLEIENLKKPVRKSKEYKTDDIIVTKYEKVTEYKNGEEITRRVPKSVNVTKLVNETKKLIKQTTAEEKLAELEKVFSK